MENSLQQHQMVLEKTFPSGTEEWYCPTCGRRFIMNWPPNYKKTVLEPGNENVAHSAGKGVPGLEFNLSAKGSDLSIPNDPERRDEEDQPVDEPWLVPWQEWLDKINFEDRWHG